MRHGFLLINKPRGPSSHDAVAKVRCALGERSVGHLGTLDPLADGLLVLAVGGKALKVVELFSSLEKEYLADVRLGATSTTYDAEGAITETALKPGWSAPEDASRIQVLVQERFTGNISQVPPKFSAVSIGGSRAYRKAQRGETFEMPSRQVQIHSCIVDSYVYPKLVLRVRCGAGTYIRSLANDLGQSLHCGGYLAGLQRTKVGEWSVQEAVQPDAAAWKDVLPLKAVLTQFAKRELTDVEWDDIRNGRCIAGTIESSPLIAWHGGLPVAVLERNPKVADTLKPRKVLV